MIVQDADLEYDPAEYPRLLEPIEDGRADVVFGSRFVGEPAPRARTSGTSRATAALTLLSNVFTNLNLSDMETCYKVVSPPRRARSVHLQLRPGFGVEPEITAQGGPGRIAGSTRCRFRTSAAPTPRARRSGWRDGLSALWTIIKFRFVD